MKILIAEDEFTTRTMVQVSLESWGYDVLDASNGEEAIALFQRGKRPRIVILDWEMPEVDGLEACQRIKELNPEDPPYVILLTGRDSQKDILTGFDAGADDYITKPFSSEELRARVRVAERLVRTQDMLNASVTELKTVLDQLEALQGSVVVCPECHNIEREEDASWHDLTSLTENGGDSRFVSVVCPACKDGDQ